MVYKTNIQFLNDAEIVDGIGKQDTEVLRYLYRMHYARVRKYVLSNNGNISDAEDLFQDLLVFMYEKCRNKSLHLTSTLDAYLFVVMRNMWLNQLRRRKPSAGWIFSKKMPPEEIADESIISPEELIETEKEGVFYKHFRSLGEDCKKVLLLFIQGKSVTEVTREMGYSSEQHAKNRRYRCKLSLFSKIKADPRYKELYNGTANDQDDQVPRW